MTEAIRQSRHETAVGRELSQPCTRLPLRVGARTIGVVKKRISRVSLNLDQIRLDLLPLLPPLSPGSDGYLITSVASDKLDCLQERHPELRLFVRHRYARSFIAFEGSFDDYLQSFSGKTRSTLKRKERKLASLSGGFLDARLYRGLSGVDEFHHHARNVSAKTYQEKVLKAGLPQGEDFHIKIRSLAREDAYRGWVLFLDSTPISYLYLPAVGKTLIYSHLGYDPDHAALSPGTVLQLEAIRQLFEEKRFSALDFTEGDGQHKRLFATDGIECVDLLLLTPTLSNFAAAYFLNGFDRLVALGRRTASALQIDAVARRLVK